ncbi:MULTISPECIES: hypothetical protein [Paenibacillus]|uniref:Uncharacterized protein n=1 Tax=Paenibacillus residui TaxID=629724 RepID=A0ABW3DFA9_9BACL|nr:hypothetical protein [Paenibacillus sp. 32O-W]
MWSEIADLIKLNPAWSLVITILGTLLVWLYKEFKVMLAKEFNDKVAILQNKLEVYGRLEAAVVNLSLIYCIPSVNATRIMADNSKYPLSCHYRMREVN